MLNTREAAIVQANGFHKLLGGSRSLANWETPLTITHSIFMSCAATKTPTTNSEQIVNLRRQHKKINYFSLKLFLITEHFKRLNFTWNLCSKWQFLFKFTQIDHLLFSHYTFMPWTRNIAQSRFLSFSSFSKIFKDTHMKHVITTFNTKRWNPFFFNKTKKRVENSFTAWTKYRLLLIL